jgi:hypothetical protein
MSIQEWAALAEITGAIAVVASLVYLAVQIRQNTHELSLSLKSTELAAFERNVESGNRVREMFILNPEVSELYARGVKSYADLGDNEKLRFDMVLSNVFSALQGAYVRQLTYGNDPANFAGSERTLDQLIRLSGVRNWLNRSQPDWRPQFTSLVEQRVNLFEEAAEKASAEGQEESSSHTDE